MLYMMNKDNIRKIWNKESIVYIMVILYELHYIRIHNILSLISYPRAYKININI
jgi:hypothetical protein